MEEAKVIEIIGEQLGISTSELDEDTVLADLGADSLDLFQIISALEEEFEIEFDNKEKLIIDLTVLGNVTQRVAKELDEMERKLNEKLSLGLMASFMAMGIDKKDLKDIFKEIK